MVSKHSISFFQKTTGMIISSNSRENDYIFVKMIKDKGNNIWEKPSQGEGQGTKFSLKEMIEMEAFLDGEMGNEWSAFHSFKESKTSIKFKWNDDHSGIGINIGNYSKMLLGSELSLFKRLLEHLIEEKIEYSTTPKRTVKEMEVRIK